MLLSREYRKERNTETPDFAAEYAAKNVPFPMRAADRLMRLAEREQPHLTPWDRFGFRRSRAKIPSLFTKAEWDALYQTHFVFDRGWISNIDSDYELMMSRGLDDAVSEIERRKETASPQQKEEAEAMLLSLKAVYTVAERYRDAARENGNAELYEALQWIPANKPRTFYEACLFFRLLNFMLWLNDNKHITIGRFDQYMYPYYRKDVEEGKLSEDDALEIIEELFISLNFDADLYPGVQQGDNGQSLVLGGCDRDGKDAYNGLSRLCLLASSELKLIDPKINLRVNRSTPRDVYRLGTVLTSKGLGFPQYSNDDVVIPALIRWGYDPEDARNYVVAACWEFIIPGKAFDIDNIDAFSFPAAVDRALRQGLPKTFEQFREQVRNEIDRTVAEMIAPVKNMFFQPSPLQSVFMTGCVENLRDVCYGLRYNNTGLHGAGIANGVDAMAAIKQCLYEDRSIAYNELIDALDRNFEGCESLHKKLLAAPKMGNNDDRADDEAVFLLNCFADACDRHGNERGGRWRAGTGSAMYYIWCAEKLGATADGRKAGEYFSANYSPSLNVKVDGVLSVIASFTKPDLMRVCNGGPLTLEFHDTVFRNQEGMDKVADLVRLFIELGGHQLQLNAINRETLLDAQKHPEKYPQLIVRVWGWSGYFNELDLHFQNHVISRIEY